MPNTIKAVSNENLAAFTSALKEKIVSKSEYERDEKVIAAALNDLNDRVEVLEEAPGAPELLSDLTDDSTHRLVTDAEKTVWNGKYTKPGTGIPVSDFSSAVQASLEKIDNISSRGVSIDFGINEDTVCWVNMFGSSLTISRVVTTNCTSIYVSYGQTLRSSIIPGTVNLIIPVDSQIIWEIVRTTDSARAALAFEFVINNN